MRIALLRVVLYFVCLSAMIILGQFIYEIRRTAEQQFNTDFRAQTSEFTNEVEHSLDTAINYVLSIGAFFESSEEILEDEFARFVIRSRFLSDAPHLRSISIIPYLRRDEVAGFNRELRAREEIRSYYEYAPFQVRYIEGRDHYAPVTYIVGPDSKSGLLGSDLAGNAEVMSSAQAALISTQPHMTPPISLNADHNENSHDVLIVSAVKNSGDMGLRDGAEGDKPVFIAATYSPAIAISDIVAGTAFGAQFDICIYDVTDNDPVLLYRSNNIRKNAAPDFTDNLVYGNRVWALEYYRPLMSDVARNVERFMILGVIGIVLILLLTIAIDRLIRRRGLLESQVHERTEQLHEMNEALMHSAQQANAESDAKSMFLAHMSHELRTPLNAIIGYAQMLKNEPFGKLGDARYSEYAGTIEEAGNIQLQFVEDILSLTALQGGHRGLEPREIDLCALAEKCVSLLHTRIEDHDLDVTVECDMEDPTFEVDERSLQQIFLNLLSNAIKFTPDGGSIVVRLSRDDDGTTIVAVQDNGIGIDADNIDKVLQPFGQAQVNAYNSREGVGLGLSIVTGLAQANGGVVRIESIAGEGTTVIVEFPRDNSAGAE